MNYTAPTFHFQQGDEVCFQTSLSLQQQQQLQPPPTIQDMFVMGPSVVVDHDHHRPSMKFPLTQRRNLSEPVVVAEDGVDENRYNKKRKIIHRDVERQRRHEMAMLYSSLRSLLPIEYLKGKRSISDHMNEAANYIKHQQKKIQELTEKRDVLRRAIMPSSNPESLHDSGGFPSPSVRVEPCLAGVEVIIGSGPLMDGLPLSLVIQVLEEEGFAVLRSAFTKVKEQFFYTIQCEVRDQREIDMRGLQQKLMDWALTSC